MAIIHPPYPTVTRDMSGNVVLDHNTVVAVAYAIAAALGDNYDSAFISKDAWNKARGMTYNYGPDRRARWPEFRDINMPFKGCYEDAAQAAVDMLLPGSGSD